MLTHLIPGFYLQKVAEREKDPDKKELTRQKSQELLSVLASRNAALLRIVMKRRFTTWNERPENLQDFFKDQALVWKGIMLNSLFDTTECIA